MTTAPSTPAPTAGITWKTEDPRCKIAYLIPHLPQSLEQASVFGWYTEGLHAAAGPILTASALPADIREAHTELKYVLIHRLIGTIWPAILPVETTSLRATLSFIPTPFRICISTTKEVAEIVDKEIAASPWPILHASTITGAGRTPLAALDVAAVSNHVNRVLDALATNPKWVAFVKAIRNELRRAPRRRAKKHPLKAGLHNVVAPNERALEAFGRKFVTSSRISEPLMRDPDPNRYISRICESADAVQAERANILKDVTPDLIDNRLILAVPSVYWGIHRKWKDRLQSFPEAHRKNIKQALKNVVHSSTYFDNVEMVDAGEKYVLAPEFDVVMRERARDMLSFTATLTSLSTSTLVPVLRLEPKVNSVRSHIRQLAHCVRTAAQPHSEWKASRMANDLGAKLRNLVDPKFLERIDAPESTGRIEGMKIVADAPLEFLLSDDLPISLRFDCSRISPIPGNLSHQIAMIPPLRIPKEHFQDVLVIRSFSRTDPLRNMLEDAIRAGSASNPLKHVRCRFVDVSSSAEVVDVLNTHTGAIVIFDCHGAYTDEGGLGSLIVGGKPLHFWDLRGKCSLPPIVMFSACDTQPIDGSHGSVATSTFTIGARAVLATYFPILANRAAVFNARMLLRLDAYIPAALASRRQVTWREVVSGMLRMTYVTEVQLNLKRYAGINLTRDAMSAIQLETSTYISARHPQWHRILVEGIARQSALDVDEVQTLMNRWCSLTDSMKYVQLGNPERIIITDS